MKILFYEVGHLVQIFTSVHPFLSVYIFTGSKTIFAKKKSGFFSPKILEIFFLSKSVLGYYNVENDKKKSLSNFENL